MLWHHHHSCCAVSKTTLAFHFLACANRLSVTYLGLKCDLTPTIVCTNGNLVSASYAVLWL